MSLGRSPDGRAAGAGQSCGKVRATTARATKDQIKNMGRSDESTAREHHQRLRPVHAFGTAGFGAGSGGARSEEELRSESERRAGAQQRQQPPTAVLSATGDEAERGQRRHRNAGRALEGAVSEEGEPHHRQQSGNEWHGQAMNSAQRREQGADQVEPPKTLIPGGGDV